jgi:hypothetical protein
MDPKFRMQPIQPTLPLQPRRPPPIWAEKEIEAARRRTWELYHLPLPTGQLDNWYLDEILDPYIAPRVKDLYDDREQTTRQQGAFFGALMSAKKPTTWDHNISTHIEPEPSDLEVMYTRLLALYDARQMHIQHSAVSRLSLWSDWWQEHHKPYYLKNVAFIAACEATIAFMEDDYIKRKVDFVTEVYAVLEKHDLGRAKRVLDDLGEMWPWLSEDFCRRLEGFVVAYDGLKRVRVMKGLYAW